MATTAQRSAARRNLVKARRARRSAGTATGTTKRSTARGSRSGGGKSSMMSR